MRYEIKGGAFPIVVCNLESGEKMITSGASKKTKGARVWLRSFTQMG